MLDRAAIIAGIRRALEGLDAVTALFEAGSASFGRADDYSDIDLVADVVPGEEEVVFTVLEAALAALVTPLLPAGAEPFVARKLIPLPAWHGMQQRFYKLAGVSEWLLLDISLRPADQPGHFAELARHGEPQIIFDKTGAVCATGIDETALAARRQSRLGELRENLELFGNFAEKECRRGRELDALAMYHGMLLRPLVELLRMKHDPQRFDFGLRYLAFDLPAEVTAELRPLFFVSGIEDIMQRQARVREWMAELLEELARANEA